MFDIILFGLVTFGITNIIVNGSILYPLRKFIWDKSKFFGALFSCAVCTGFWVGILVSALTTIGVNDSVILDGFLSSAVCAVLLEGLIVVNNHPLMTSRGCGGCSDKEDKVEEDGTETTEGSEA